MALRLLHPIIANDSEYLINKILKNDKVCKKSILRRNNLFHIITYNSIQGEIPLLTLPVKDLCLHKSEWIPDRKSHKGSG